jgi:hypothetical protein
MFDARNLPKNLMRGEDEVIEKREKAAQVQDNREQLEQDNVASDTVKNMQVLEGGRQ